MDIARKPGAPDMTGPDGGTPLPARFCTEIRLFDLCTLEQCRFREGRYCVNSLLLARFEAIAEQDERTLLAEDDDMDEDDDFASAGYDEGTDEEREDE
jgi:hypothetical protein